MDYILEVNHLSKIRGTSVILNDISFGLTKGKIYGLVGANGSGKSTLLQIILGLYKFKGDVFINGYNIRSEYRDALKSASGIVDYVSFYEYLTAYENLRYFSLLYDTPFNRINEVMKIVNLDIKDKRIVKKYSLGMKQRLGIAISLLKDPEVLILDEPTNGLDPKGIVELRHLLLSFKDKTIIISSHIISEIEKIVDEVLFLNDKKIVKKTIDRDNGKYLIKFKVGNNEKASKIIPGFTLEENNSIYMSNEEINNSVKMLVKENVPVYRVEEDSSLENMLINMMDGENNV